VPAASSVVRAAFVGTTNSKTCPVSYSQVTSEAACKSLAAIGDKLYGGSVNFAFLPLGCFWFTVGGGDGVYLNTHANGRKHANTQLLCAGALAPPTHA
jgi:hypothetical protein